MPIEKAMAFDDKLQPEVESEEVVAEEPAETVTISMEMLGGKSVKPGDVVRLEVVDVSDEDGTVSVRYPKMAKTGGIKEAAASFDEGIKGDM